MSSKVIMLILRTNMTCTLSKDAPGSTPSKQPTFYIPILYKWVFTGAHSFLLILRKKYKHFVMVRKIIILRELQS